MNRTDQPPGATGTLLPATGKKLSYLSVCSGIEAASVAWEPFGFQPVAFSEIEPFPSAVLAHHYPDVPNLGDMTQYANWTLPSIDILAGGTPCQSFSVAGKRLGLSDERGNLCLTFCEMADHFDPAWVVWENVPGVLSSMDNAFGCLLGKLCGFGSPVPPPAGRKHRPCGVVAGPKRTVAWRVMDAQWHGVPQRRRRVFVLASREVGNWAAADALLPLGDRLPRHLEARRKARQKASPGTRTSLEGSHWDGGVHPTLGAVYTGIGMSDQELFAQRGANLVCSGLYENQHAEMRLYEGVQPTLTCGGGKAGQGSNIILMEYLHEKEGSHLYENHPQDSRITGPHAISPSCTARWGTGGGNVPLVLHEKGVGTCPTRSASTVQEAWCMPVNMRALLRRDSAPNASHGLGEDGEPSFTLTASSHTPAVCFAIQGEIADGCRQNQNGLGISEGISYTLTASTAHAVSWTGAVRRLIPVECERLQGFPDGWTLIEKSPGKPYADSHRYKAVGNSMAVPCMHWLGRRILKITARHKLLLEEQSALQQLQALEPSG